MLPKTNDLTKVFEYDHVTQLNQTVPWLGYTPLISAFAPIGNGSDKEVEVNLACMKIVDSDDFSSAATIGERIFEYVIIGGGTAGTVLANRLSENSSVSVALVEAGGSALDNPLARTIYGNCPACDTPLDWNYTTIPQQHLNGSAKPYHAGRCLGGTSDLNGWTYLRPAMAEFRSWQAVGNPGWSWESLLHYFRKSENLQIPPASQQDQGATYIAKYHGFDGPLDIAWPPRLDVGSYGRALNQTWQSLGLGWNPDANSGLPRGLF
ncbi:alcohol oxidase, partial [Aureobasidium melanogenum]